jgi:hypothetical protein
MAACEKCWGDAYMRSMWNGKSQAQNYQDLLQERKDNPCSKEQQTGEFIDGGDCPTCGGAWKGCPRCPECYPEGNNVSN